jgi:phage terminase small subunit
MAIIQKKGSENMLTAKQEKFAQGIALENMNYSAAYRSAYDTKKMSDKTVNEKASLLASDDKVRTRIKELRDTLVTPKIMTAQERLEWLTDTINSDEESTSDKLKAVDIMNKMQGEYVQKVQAEVSNAISINIELSDE